MDISKPHKIEDNFSSTVPFIYKLWIVINSKNNCIKWDATGHNISIVVKELILYLEDVLKNIFSSKNILDFCEMLEKFGFVKLQDEFLENPDKVEGSSEFYFYTNTNFQKGKFELLKNFLNPLNNQAMKKPLKNETTKRIYFKPYHQTDPAHRIIDKMKTYTRKRIGLTLTLQKILCSNILLNSTNSPIITIPAHLFKSSSDSVSGFEEKIEYAGFYGESIEFKDLQNIFGTYLPIYLQTNDDSATNIMDKTEFNLSENECTQISEEKVFNDTNLNIAEITNFGASDCSKSIRSKILPENLIKAAPLEPIDNQDSKITNGNEDEIFMEDYLKFNKNESSLGEVNLNSSLKNISGNFNEADGDNNQDKENTLIKNENDADEYSFKSFFNQYSNSMSILLEE